MVVLICISLMMSDVYLFFHVLVGHLNVFFGEVSIHVFCPFLHWIICFLGVEFDNFFIDFWILTLFLICRLQISSPDLLVVF